MELVTKITPEQRAAKSRQKWQERVHKNLVDTIADEAKKKHHYLVTVKTYGVWSRPVFSKKFTDYDEAVAFINDYKTNHTFDNYIRFYETKKQGNVLCCKLLDIY